MMMMMERADPRSAAPEGERPRPRVLLVDDEPDLLAILAAEITHAGFDVICASSGLEALRQAEQGRFDLALTDYKMPGLDGLQTVDALAKLDPAVRTVMMTGYISEEVRAALRLRRRPWIEKPFDIHELIATLQEALRPDAEPDLDG